MAVYVDKLEACIPSEKWPWNRSCHLIADHVDELHSFAKRLGLKRAWFQGKQGFPHYDLTPGMRNKAMRTGVNEISDKKDWLTLVQRMRVGWHQEGF